MNLSDLDPNIFILAAEEMQLGSTYCCNAIRFVCYLEDPKVTNEEEHVRFFQNLSGIGDAANDIQTFQDGRLWGLTDLDAVPHDHPGLAETRLLSLYFAAAVLEWEQENTEFEFGEPSLGHSHYCPPDNGIEHLYT
jgi:hypothetical protein